MDEYEKYVSVSDDNVITVGDDEFNITIDRKSFIDIQDEDDRDKEINNIIFDFMKLFFRRRIKRYAFENDYEFDYPETNTKECRVYQVIKNSVISRKQKTYFLEEGKYRSGDEITNNIGLYFIASDNFEKVHTSAMELFTGKNEKINDILKEFVLYYNSTDDIRGGLVLTNEEHQFELNISLLTGWILMGKKYSAKYESMQDIYDYLDFNKYSAKIVTEISDYFCTSVRDCSFDLIYGMLTISNNIFYRSSTDTVKCKKLCKLKDFDLNMFNTDEFNVIYEMHKKLSDLTGLERSSTGTQCVPTGWCFEVDNCKYRILYRNYYAGKNSRFVLVRVETYSNPTILDHENLDEFIELFYEHFPNMPRKYNKIKPAQICSDV